MKIRIVPSPGSAKPHSSRDQWFSCFKGKLKLGTAYKKPGKPWVFIARRAQFVVDDLRTFLEIAYEKLPP